MKAIIINPDGTESPIECPCGRDMFDMRECEDCNEEVIICENCGRENIIDHHPICGGNKGFGGTKMVFMEDAA